MKHRTTVTRERKQTDGDGCESDVEYDLEIAVEYSFDKPSGDGWNEPRDPGGFYVESAEDSSGNEVELTEDEEQNIITELEEAHRECDDDRPRRRRWFSNANRDYESDLG